MNTIKELTQQEKYNTMLKRKNREIKSLKEQLELLVKDDEKYQETIIKQSKEIERLNKENKNLKEDFKRHIDRINELTNIIDKAIEYVENVKVHKSSTTIKLKKELLNILKGIDKEWKRKTLKDF